MPALKPVRRPAWQLYLAGMALLTSAYVLAHYLGPRALNSGPVYNVIGASTVIALIVGAKKNSPGRRLPWYLFALGQALFVTGDVLAYNYHRFFGTELPSPSVADAFYLAFYPLLIVGLLMLLRERNETSDRASLIDSSIITMAAAALAWVVLMAPYVNDPTLKLPTKLISIAYPLMDVLVLGVVVRLAVGSRRREPAFAFLICGTAALLISDSIYGWKLLHGGYTTGAALDAGWALFYALLGAAALHPSMRSLSKPAPSPDARLTRRRLTVLALVSVVAPAMLVVRAALGESLEVYVLAYTSAALFILVIMRMAGIVRRHEETVRREEALRRREEAMRVAGEALVAASNRQEVYAAALEGVRSVVDDGARARVYLSEGDSNTLRAVSSTEGDVAGIAPLRVEELPAGGREMLSKHVVVTLDQRDQLICLAPLLFHEELRGILAVLPDARLAREVQESFSTLAVEVALALENVTLTEAALSSEARLSSLIKNASDVVCVVGEGANLRYMSPSVERIFGHAPGSLEGGRLIDIVHPGDVQLVLALLANVAAKPAGDAHTGEFRLRHLKKGWREVEAVATNLISDLAVEGVVINIRDISERKAFEAELEHQAFHDYLSGLPNRRLFRNRVEQALAAQRRDGRPVAVMFLDVDDFKNVNDSLGHAAGDELLREVARRLDGCMRMVDTAARLGGDEFALLIESCESELQPVEIAERVMDELGVPYTLEGRVIATGTSIGIALSGKGTQELADADQLLRHADAAMYLAKQRGKGNYQIFEPEMQAQALTRLGLKADLQRALDAEEFTLHYQPVMDLERRDIAGMEALVRWKHPVRGIVAPMEFIPLAEDTGLILPLGRHILMEACQKVAVLQRDCPRQPSLWISVNVSGRQLQSPQLVGDVRAALEESGIQPDSLVLELTESMMMQDIELTTTRLQELRSLGVRLAIDDFGTGYSSLNYIRQFAVDLLKIDRSFVSDPSPQVAELTAAMVDLARIFKLQAVAEGIENNGQMEFAQSICCDFGQGFHFAEPLSGDQMLTMAVEQSRTVASHRLAPAVAIS